MIYQDSSSNIHFEIMATLCFERFVIVRIVIFLFDHYFSQCDKIWSAVQSAAQLLYSGNYNGNGIARQSS